jgi:hypothetical protein
MPVKIVGMSVAYSYQCDLSPAANPKLLRNWRKRGNVMDA